MMNCNKLTLRPDIPDTVRTGTKFATLPAAVLAALLLALPPSMASAETLSAPDLTVTSAVVAYGGVGSGDYFEATLSWTHNSDDDTLAVDSFEYRYKCSAGSGSCRNWTTWSVVQDGSSTASSQNIRVSGMQTGTWWRFQVRAVAINSDGATVHATSSEVAHQMGR